MLDSEWEAELARVLEAHPRVLCYAKNQGMQFEIRTDWDVRSVATCLTSWSAPISVAPTRLIWWLRPKGIAVWMRS